MSSSLARDFCGLAHSHFFLFQPIWHNAKVVTSSPIDQHALMIVQTTSNSVFIGSPFQAPEQTFLTWGNLWALYLEPREEPSIPEIQSFIFLQTSLTGLAVRKLALPELSYG
ncbi:MAG: hypothetical protein JO251_00570 [Verrucomicrobia bacterium]|nr:hypothetical protein [Verrucomicrobiota bacterium]